MTVDTTWPWLGRCVADPERFLAEDWAVRPSFQRGTESRFSGIFSLEELDQILAMGNMHNVPNMLPRIKMVKINMGMPDAAFMQTKRRIRTVIDCGRIAK